MMIIIITIQTRNGGTSADDGADDVSPPTTTAAERKRSKIELRAKGREIGNVDKRKLGRENDCDDVGMHGGYSVMKDDYCCSKSAAYSVRDEPKNPSKHARDAAQ